MARPTEPRRQIVEVGLRLQQRGFLAGSDGNLSVRLDDGRILITPAGVAKGRLEPADLVVVSPEGQKLEGTGSPTSEMAMHLAVYSTRADINACVHSHPPNATAFAVAGEPLPDDILPEVVVFVGSIPLCEYAPPGTEAVPASLVPYIKTNCAFLLRNHGLLTIGRTLEEASNRHETVEHYAHILRLAKQLGSWNRIPKRDFQRLTRIRQKTESRLSSARAEAEDI
ncbi:class II aldolase family protein [candidate division GN15 bacterium]|uniref:Class II aldolase family protein n=1 Tax=candidate division GN15 bacterium TaxID=2072418 RepID=A0A855X3F0_9BACT|nr:MAG: class II aldolase family protein [candidate division GN15 bacterium]